MKIIQVINAMISNPDLITNVVKNQHEYFFLYNLKHKWSISIDDDGEYYLNIYPTENPNFDVLATYNGDWTQINYVSYNTKELKTNEALESFSELYKIVSDRLLGIDEIFDDILQGF